MAEKLYSYADKQVIEKVGSGGGGGGGGSSLIIHVDENNTLDKTWKQIYDHIANGGTAVIIAAGNIQYSSYNYAAAVSIAGHDVNGDISSYSIVTAAGEYTTLSENGYPATE